jgi:hypothetical protein
MEDDGFIVQARRGSANAKGLALWSSRPARARCMAGLSLLAPAAARLPWGVAALLLATGDALAARFGAVAVRGELSGFNRAASGHCYFALKDADGAPALLRCAMFRRAAALVDFAPADGQQVELRGRLGVYEARGELQMIVESLQRVGTARCTKNSCGGGPGCRPRVCSTVPASVAWRLSQGAWAWSLPRRRRPCAMC